MSFFRCMYVISLAREYGTLGENNSMCVPSAKISWILCTKKSFKSNLLERNFENKSFEKLNYFSWEMVKVVPDWIHNSQGRNITSKNICK